MKTIIQVEQEPQLNVSVEESTENILVNVFQSPDINIEVSGIVYGDSNVDLSNYWTKTESDSKYKPIGYVPTWNSITGKPIFLYSKRGGTIWQRRTRRKCAATKFKSAYG